MEGRWKYLTEFRFENDHRMKGEFRFMPAPSWLIEQTMNQIFPEKNCSAREEMERRRA